MTIAIWCLSIALAAALITGGVGWYRYHCLMQVLQVITKLNGMSVEQLNKINEKAQSIAADALR